MTDNEKRKSTKPRKHYSACDACNIRQGGVSPNRDSCITVSMGTCPYCKKENQTLIPWVDYDWPRDHVLDITAKVNRD